MGLTSVSRAKTSSTARVLENILRIALLQKNSRIPHLVPDQTQGTRFSWGPTPTPLSPLSLRIPIIAPYFSVRT